MRSDGRIGESGDGQICIPISNESFFPEKEENNIDREKKLVSIVTFK
jgi:hypothetical protein